MKKLLALALVAVAVPAPALAGPDGHGQGRGGDDRVREAPPARPDRADAPRHGRHRGPALVARGTIAALDAAAGTFTLELRGGNRHLRRVADGLTTLTVTLDVETALDPFTTRIRAAGAGRAAVTDLAAGDRVVVTWRAPRGTTAEELAAIEARRVTARTPRPAAGADDPVAGAEDESEG